MQKLRVLCLVASSAFLTDGVAQTQVTADLREQLLINDVVLRDTHVYATASAPQRGTFEGTQEWLFTRALRNMTHKLCAFEAAQGRRLEAGLQGVKLLSAEVRGQEMVVIIGAPMQKPSCKVTIYDPVQSPSEGLRNADNPPRSVSASEPRAPDIVIRKFGGEY